MHMVLAAGNSLFPASCSVHSENTLTCMYRKMLNFSRPNVPRIYSSCITFLHMPSVLMCYTIYVSISDAAAHNFGWDDTGGTGDWNKFRANNEICGRDCKVLPFALSLHLLLALVSNSNNTVHLLTQTGDTIKHNQPHTQVDFRASVVKVRFHLLPVLNVHASMVWSEPQETRLALELTFSSLKRSQKWYR